MHTRICLTFITIVAAAPCAIAKDPHTDHPDKHELKTTFSDQPAPMRLDDVPDRPRPILELGDPFLGVGPIAPGIDTPTGAVLQPSLLVFGQHRSAFQSFNNGDEVFTEWVNRLDLFANLQLSGTERLFVGLRPLDNGRNFTGYFFEPGNATQTGWDDELNGQITHLFFEGDFGEIFPSLDDQDSKPLDIGFSVGRQPLFYQEGLLINDRVDAVGITKNNIFPEGLNNLQATFIYGWNEVNRGNNREDNDAQLFGLFLEADTDKVTLNLDTVFVLDEDAGPQSTDALFLAASAVQRIGKINTSFRALASLPFDDESPEVGQGELLFAELSYTPAHSDDILYATAFWAIDEFTSAARGPDTGGPLGRAGLSFAAVGLGRYGAPLGNAAQNAVGGAVGYQHFFNEKRSQIVIEAGVRSDTNNTDASAAAFSAGFQTAIGQNNIFRIDAFIAAQENREPASGVRAEWQIKF